MPNRALVFDEEISILTPLWDRLERPRKNLKVEVTFATVKQEKLVNSENLSVDQPLSERQRENAQMFDRIAHRYDFLNCLLSLRRDVTWRRRLVDHLPEGSKLHHLDVATGTGDLLLSLAEHSDRLCSGVGIDLSGRMLRVGKSKIDRSPYSDHISLILGDGAMMPFPDNCFDVLTIGFGIRNFADTSRGLREFYRVLKPSGRLLVLEFSLPTNRVFYYGYLAYFRFILPVIGRLFSGDIAAYRYLNKSVESFPYGQKFCDLITDAGFVDVNVTPLTFGVASIYQGDKAS